MKKYFFPILMGLTILAGLALTFTPYLIGLLTPATQTRTATPEQVAQALAAWFQTTPDQIQAPQGIQQLSAQGSTAWFAFRTAPERVIQFIHLHRLQQRPLSTAVLEHTFALNDPPAPWWQPQALQRETYFVGTAEGKQLALIYHAELQQGYLVARSQQQRGSPLR